MSQLYPKEKNDDVIPIIEFKECSKKLISDTKICENKEWIYYTREGISNVDKNIKLDLDQKGTVCILLEHLPIKYFVIFRI